MQTKKKAIVIVVFSIFFLNLGYSQADSREIYRRNSFWTETVFNGTVHNKWKWQLDYQYRRQSDASDISGASKNPFKYAFQHVYRPWVHYQLRDNIRFSLSPLGFWETITPASETGNKQKIQPEFRICPQVTLTNKYGRVTIDQRYRFEFRFIGTKVDDPNNNDFSYSSGMDFPDVNHKKRFRYFVRAIVPLGKHTKLEENTFYIIAWNELFLGVGKNTNNDKIWDQNRTFCLLGYKPKMSFPMRFEIGYGLQYANRFSSSFANGSLVESGHKIENNNLMQVYIIFEDFNRLFSKSKK